MKKLIKLNSSVAVLNQKLNNIHFNYRGDSFRSVHLFTEELYKEFLEVYDDLSEKVAMQDLLVPATFKEHLELSFIKEIESKKYTLKEVSEFIVSDLTLIIDWTNEMEAINTVQPLIDEVALIADKYRWLFKSLV